MPSSSESVPGRQHGAAGGRARSAGPDSGGRAPGGLTATGGRLHFDGEFLAWDEIDAIGVGAGQDGAELLVRLSPAPRRPRSPPRARRLLRHVVDPARLAAALPPDVRADAVTPA